MRLSGDHREVTRHGPFTEHHGRVRAAAALWCRWLPPAFCKPAALPLSSANDHVPYPIRDGLRSQRGRALSVSGLMHFDKDIATLCRENGLRLTGPRRVIMQVLAASSDHPDVVELHRRVNAIDPGIALATVYRTVSLLQDKGVLERHIFADGRARYETADQEHHDHLIDVETGDVIEFRSDEIEKLQEDIARRHGYAIVSHRLEIYVRKIRKGRSGKV